MPSFTDWSRADIIAALALAVSVLAFVASAISSFISWRTYVASNAAREPKLRAFFEPFDDTDRWWVANFRLRNRSDHVLRFEKITITWPLGVAFSSWIGGISGQASGSGPWHYSLPEEVEHAVVSKSLTRIVGRDIDLEFQPTGGAEHLPKLIVKTPRWRFGSSVQFRIDMFELAEMPRRISFAVGAPFPTKENTKPRWD